MFQCFWALGACFEVLLALLIMPTMGWQWLLALSTAPLLAFACICPVSILGHSRLELRKTINVVFYFQWLPESARFHVASGQPEKALSTLQKVSRASLHVMFILSQSFSSFPKLAYIV